MQREIKFRAWDTNKQKMYSAYEMGQDELQINPDGRGFFNASSISPKLSEYFPHMIPLQYTGLKDSKGREIYEGDIVKYKARSYGGFYDEDVIVIGEVMFNYAKWRVERRKANPDNRMTPEFEFHFNAKYIEVIGNIYQDKELLSPELDKG